MNPQPVAAGKILLTLLSGWLGYRIARRLHLSAPGMVGSMFGAAVFQVLSGWGYLPTAVKVAAQALSGAYIGMQITREDIRNMKHLLVPFLILIVMFTVNTFFLGYLFSGLGFMDRLTALLGCVAGGVSDISMLAIDMNAEASTVAVMQTARLFGVLAIFPIWIRKITEKAGIDNSRSVDQRTRSTSRDETKAARWGKTIFTIVLALIFGWLGKRSGLPAGAMVLPMFVVMALNCTVGWCEIPPQIKLVDQIMAGSVVGCTVTYQAVMGMYRLMLPILILLASYFLLNYVYSRICVRFDLLDLKSALFASAPGGATDMSLIAADLGADLSKIALIQVFRAAYAVTVMPTLITLVTS